MSFERICRRLVTSGVFLLVLMYFSMGHTMFHLPLPKFLDGNHIGITVIQMVLAAIVMFINKKFFVSGWKSVRSGAPSMDTLVAMGTMTSFLWSFYILMQMTRSVTDGDTKAVMAGMHNLYFESAAMIVTLITVVLPFERASRSLPTVIRVTIIAADSKYRLCMPAITALVSPSVTLLVICINI